MPHEYPNTPRPFRSMAAELKHEVTKGRFIYKTMKRGGTDPMGFYTGNADALRRAIDKRDEAFFRREQAKDKALWAKKARKRKEKEERKAHEKQLKRDAQIQARIDRRERAKQQRKDAADAARERAKARREELAHARKLQAQAKRAANKTARAGH